MQENNEERTVPSKFGKVKKLNISSEPLMAMKKSLLNRDYL